MISTKAELDEEAARRGVTTGFLRAEQVQKARRSLFGPIAEARAPVTKEAMAKLGAHFWPHTFGKDPSYEGAVTALRGHIEELRVSMETHVDLALPIWSLVEAIEVPDAHMQLIGACRWADQGFPVVELGHRYAAALMATSVPAEVVQDVRAPWKAFMIEIPPLGLILRGKENEEDEIRRIFVWSETRGDEEAAWGYFTMCLEQPITLWFIDRLGKLVEADVTSQWDSLPFALPQDDRDHRLRVLLHRLILNTCLAMSDPSNLKAIGGSHKKAWSGPTKRMVKDPEFRHFRLGQPVKIDCRETIREYVEGNVKRGAINVQVLVRGHWKRQPYGPKAALRKVIWVEPYWKGPEESPVIVRPHTIREEAGV
jgi:hypothetical protein